MFKIVAGGLIVLEISGLADISAWTICLWVVLAIIGNIID